MTRPQRWLEHSGELSELEREVLFAGANLRPPVGAKAATRVAITAATGGAAIGITSAKAALGAAQATGAGSATTLVFLKGLGLGLVLGTALAGGVTILSSARNGALPPRPALSSPVVARATKTATARGEVPAELPLVRSPEPTPNPGPPTSSSGQHSTSRLSPSAGTAEDATRALSVPSGTVAFPDSAPSAVAFTTVPTPASVTSATALAESREVADARRALRSGDPRGALTRLQALGREFPNGILVQERDALVIEALSAAGDSGAARERAKSFLERYPKSPHAAAAWRALEQP